MPIAFWIESEPLSRSGLCLPGQPHLCLLLHPLSLSILGSPKDSQFLEWMNRQYSLYPLVFANDTSCPRMPFFPRHLSSSPSSLEQFSWEIPPQATWHVCHLCCHQTLCMHAFHNTFCIAVPGVVCLWAGRWMKSQAAWKTEVHTKNGVLVTVISEEPRGVLF